MLYDLLVPKLNETLFEIQCASHFPIDPAPFIERFEITKTCPLTRTNDIFNITINSVENVLRFEYPPHGKLWVERYDISWEKV